MADICLMQLAHVCRLPFQWTQSSNLGAKNDRFRLIIAIFVKGKICIHYLTIIWNYTCQFKWVYQSIWLKYNDYISLNMYFLGHKFLSAQFTHVYIIKLMYFISAKCTQIYIIKLMYFISAKCTHIYKIKLMYIFSAKCTHTYIVELMYYFQCTVYIHKWIYSNLCILSIHFALNKLE